MAKLAKSAGVQILIFPTVWFQDLGLGYFVDQDKTRSYLVITFIYLLIYKTKTFDFNLETKEDKNTKKGPQLVNGNSSNTKDKLCQRVTCIHTHTLTHTHRHTSHPTKT